MTLSRNSDSLFSPLRAFSMRHSFRRAFAILSRALSLVSVESTSFDGTHPLVDGDAQVSSSSLGSTHDENSPLLKGLYFRCYSSQNFRSWLIFFKKKQETKKVIKVFLPPLAVLKIWRINYQLLSHSISLLVSPVLLISRKE